MLGPFDLRPLMEEAPGVGPAGPLRCAAPAAVAGELQRGSAPDGLLVKPSIQHLGTTNTQQLSTDNPDTANSQANTTAGSQPATQSIELQYTTTPQACA